MATEKTEKKAAEVFQHEHDKDHEAHRTPGTFALTLIFLLCFALYYFANWKSLADVWPVR
jgi:hypothetical protein